MELKFRSFYTLLLYTNLKLFLLLNRKFFKNLVYIFKMDFNYESQMFISHWSYIINEKQVES